MRDSTLRGPTPGFGRRALFGTALLAAVPAAAQDYPTRPIRILVGFTAGGSADIMARDIGQQLSAAWGQPVVVENRSGANGTIATQAMIASPPDGYTLLMTVSSHVTNPRLYPGVDYDPVRDVSPVTLVASSPLVILAHPRFAAGDMKAAIGAARAKPGTVTYSSPGTGSVQHLSMELMNGLAGIGMVHVPYRGGANALTDLLSGQVQLSILSIVQALPLIRQGQVKALAVTTPARAASLPEVPTLEEAGVQGYDSSLWFALLAPPRTPAPIVHRLNAEVTRMIRTPEMQARLTAQGADPIGGTEEELASFLRAEDAKWAEVIRRANVRPE
ncbi:tripartite tricarboxylate transporter substrate binding protein [Roseomonas populi]|uniref:Tripartite tricarboxylate transporter substrate binding protein n=1 Tax=Roseomonas populi TaxID=3121582 RepID=A0ABT1X7J4_9PROT|nr:tripartite tricarboxylate transporter substrate binding protein [Roseomonas pecuniae]MCR0982954.1 tripartite tricarboxylate transporter substrate binding protein [Roseomonas pecuniae]